MNISFFGSSLLSAYWNGAATYYRGIIKALYQRGHRVTFYEPDAYSRQQHRDLSPPDWAEVVVYENTVDGVSEQLEAASKADLVIKASGVGVWDELLEAGVPFCRSERTLVAFWDVDAPATLSRMLGNPADSFRPHVSKYDFIFTYGGGEEVVSDYLYLGAQNCTPIYNAVDPETHHPVSPEDRFRADLVFLGNRLPDREERVRNFFLQAAYLSPGYRFLLGGSGWDDVLLAGDVEYVGHVYTADHNALNCSSRLVLNICRESMAEYGFSPATRVFEAAGAAACVVTDEWKGIDQFFEPGKEILVARNGQDVSRLVRDTHAAEAARIGQAAYRRVLAEHTYAERARQFEEVVEGLVIP